MKYTVRRRCIKCKTYLTRMAYAHNNGVCPHCGHKGDFSATFTDSEKVVGTWHPPKGWRIILYTLFGTHGIWEEK